MKLIPYSGIFRTGVAVISIVVRGAVLYGFSQIPPDTAIETVKRLSVARLDPSLPPVKFEAWLGRVIGRQTEIRWDMNDCGEQSGDPNAGKLRDVPLCVAANADLPDGRKVSVLIHVGSNQKGLSNLPTVFNAFVETAGKRRETKHLHDLEGFLKKASVPVGSVSDLLEQNQTQRNDAKAQ